MITAPVEDRLFDKLVQIGVPALIAYLISTGIRDSLTQAGYPATQVVQYQWIGFFAALLILFGLIHVYVSVKK